MKLEDQVVSLPLAQRLKELGVNQESQFVWYYIDAPSGYAGPEIGWTGYDLPSDASEIIAAFTVAELGEMLPATIEAELDNVMTYFGLQIHKHSNWNTKYVGYKKTAIGYVLGGYEDRKTGRKSGTQNHEKQAETLGMMLEYLVINKFITL